MHMRFPGGNCPRLQCDIACWRSNADAGAPNMGRDLHERRPAPAVPILGYGVGAVALLCCAWWRVRAACAARAHVQPWWCVPELDLRVISPVACGCGACISHARLTLAKDLGVEQRCASAAITITGGVRATCTPWPSTRPMTASPRATPIMDHGPWPMAGCAGERVVLQVCTCLSSLSARPRTGHHFGGQLPYDHCSMSVKLTPGFIAISPLARAERRPRSLAAASSLPSRRLRLTRSSSRISRCWS